MNEKFDVVIIGGGHNGLVAACYLALSNKKTLILEAKSELGGASTSVRAFPDFDANLSRYSYLVSLLPDQILKDLSIDFETISRKVSSFTPTTRNDRNIGLLVNRELDNESKDSFFDLTGSNAEYEKWDTFYNELFKLAQVIAPTMLSPLLTRAEMKQLAIDNGLSQAWNDFIERPLGEVIRREFNDDLVRGVVLTDALIGTFTPADNLMANICFLYHLIGNGTGEWKVPRGGMGALVKKLTARARELGVEIRTDSKVTKIGDEGSFKTVEVNKNEIIATEFIAANCAPQILAEILGATPPKYTKGSQLKINMLLKKLPRLKSGTDPKAAFAGTFHIDESYAQLEKAFQEAESGKIPNIIPAEMYCHTLTDNSILSDDLNKAGYQTLTLFAIHTPASLFDHDNEGVKAKMLSQILHQLNQYLLDPIEECLAVSANGTLCIEVKSPQDLEKDVSLPGGNIFHIDLQFPFSEAVENTHANRWGVETDDKQIFICGAGAIRGGGVSGIGGHNAAMAILGK